MQRSKATEGRDLKSIGNLSNFYSQAVCKEGIQLPFSAKALSPAAYLKVNFNKSTVSSNCMCLINLHDLMKISKISA